MKRRFFWVLPVFIALFIWACSSDSSDDPGTDDVTGGMDDDVAPAMFDRGAMLTNWADNIIIPAYTSFSSELTELNTAFDAFSANRTVDNLVAFRQAWLDAYIAWQRVSMFETGPAETVGYRLNMNTYPTDTVLLESFVASGSYDLSLPSNRDVKGFPALDYLLNGLETDDIALVSRFDTDSDATNRLAYISDILDDMIALTDQVLQEWEGSFRNSFVSNDGSSATASTDRFVNDFIFYYEKFLRAGKMGIPLGVFTGTTAPNTIEAFYKADVSRTLFLTGLDAVQDFFNGEHFDSSATGESLASYLRFLNEIKDGVALDQVINDQFDLAAEMVNGLDTFRNEIENNSPPTDMLMAYDEVQRAVPLLKVDMVSAMSISIDFVDADGD
ncbi:imelysin family protein [Flagellimonas meridianipacifica]|uniref:Imelysin n=1 Tax=Flagellimonas meridianipacifica TaxID=1080225 RepID=A0A2T0M993_9FLAO|nr:imelysin family protein [Allomuricauda pacifica]PRX54081.1 imelysin [Allomuricauda pacifica]